MQNDLRMASLVTAKLMKNVFMPKIEVVIDKDKKISNRKMAEAVYSDIEDGGAKLKILFLSESIIRRGFLLRRERDFDVYAFVVYSFFCC